MITGGSVFSDYTHKKKSSPTKPAKERPEWVRFLFEENLGSLKEKHKGKKLAKQQEKEKQKDM